jgi:L-fucose isomerase-like protein
MPSACEGDMNALLAIMLATYTCRKSVFMGNPTYDRRSGTLSVWHDVPGLKMKGLDGPDVPFELRNFVGAGWGTTFRYDFKLDKGQPVTVSRFDPTASKVLLAKGTIDDGAGFDQIGCTLRVTMRVPKLLDLYRAHSEFGQHLAVIYGDCVDEIRQTAEFMNVRVVVVA